MTFAQSAEIYAVALAVFLLCDSLWLGKIAPKLYRKYIGHLMAKKPNLSAAAVFYLLFLVGLMVFVIVPALNKMDLAYAAGYGALFGLFTYATFDLTSQAVFKNWPSAISVIDMLWGVAITTVVSIATYSIAIHIVL